MWTWGPLPVSSASTAIVCGWMTVRSLCSAVHLRCLRAGVTPGQVWNETGGMPVCSSRSRAGVTETCISMASNICVWELKYTWKWDSACTLKYVSPHELDICVPTSASGEQIHTDGRHWRAIPLIPCRDLLRVCQGLFEVSINWFSD